MFWWDHFLFSSILFYSSFRFFSIIFGCYILLVCVWCVRETQFFLSTTFFLYHVEMIYSDFSLCTVVVVFTYFGAEIALMSTIIWYSPTYFDAYSLTECVCVCDAAYSVKHDRDIMTSPHTHTRHMDKTDHPLHVNEKGERNKKIKERCVLFCFSSVKMTVNSTV